MKKNKIVSMIEGSVKNKVLVSFLAVSLIGASGMMLSSSNASNNLSLNKNMITLAQSSSNTYTTYTVQSGDILGWIAYKYDVTVQQLQQWNNISNPNQIYIGQVIKIYAGSNSASSNSTSSSSSSQGATGYITYTIQPGNILGQIAYKYGVTVQQLQQWNNISNPNQIYIGQTLKIQVEGNTASGSSTTNTTPASNSGNSASTKTTKSVSKKALNNSANSAYSAYFGSWTINTNPVANIEAGIGNGTSSFPETIFLNQSEFVYGNNVIQNPVYKILSENSSYFLGSRQACPQVFGSNGMNEVKVLVVQSPNNTSNSYSFIINNNKLLVSNGLYFYGYALTDSSTTGIVGSTGNITCNQPKKTSATANNKKGIAYVYNLEGNGEVGIYEGPSGETTLETILKSGTQVTVLGTEYGFYKIEFGNNEIGYIPGRYLSYVKPQN